MNRPSMNARSCGGWCWYTSLHMMFSSSCIWPFLWGSSSWGARAIKVVPAPSPSLRSSGPIHLLFILFISSIITLRFRITLILPLTLVSMIVSTFSKFVYGFLEFLGLSSETWWNASWLCWRATMVRQVYSLMVLWTMAQRGSDEQKEVLEVVRRWPVGEIGAITDLGVEKFCDQTSSTNWGDSTSSWL